MSLTQAEKKQIQSWSRTRKQTNIIRFLEKKKHQDRSTEENYILGSAYITLAKRENNRIKFNKGLSLLMDLSNIYGKSVEWNTLVGDALLGAERYSSAVPFYERAVRLSSIDPAKNVLREKIIKCIKNAVLPSFTFPFRQRVTEAWLEFLEKLMEFGEILDKDVDDKRKKGIEQKFETVFDQAFVGFDSDVSKKGDRFQLKLWGLGALMLQYLMEYFKKSAPKYILKWWDIEVGKVIIPQSNKIFQMQQLFIKDAKIWIEKENEGIFNVTFYSPLSSKVVESKEINDFQPFAAMSLAYLITTAIYAKFIRLSKLVFEPLDKPFLELSEFPKYLEENGINLKENTSEVLNMKVTFTNSDLKDCVLDVLRKDIVSGWTECMKLLSASKEELMHESDVLFANGATAGWIYYSVESFVGENQEKERIDFRESFKEYLLEKCDIDDYRIIGEADGNKYDYLCLICFFPTVLHRTYEFFNNSNVSFAAFKQFDPEIPEFPLIKPVKK